MPNYELPQVQNPDILGAYIRGRAAPGALELQQQQVQGGRLELQQHQLALAMGQSRLNAANQFLSDNSGGQPTDQAPPSPGTPVPQQGEDQLSALASSSRLAGFAKMGIYDAMQNGTDPTKPIKEALDTRAAAQKGQQDQAKFNLEPLNAHYQAVLTDPHPSHLLGPNPEYMQVWRKYAPALGFNPNDPQQMTDDNVRKVATFGFNQDVAAKSMGGIAPMAMPNPLQSARGSQGQNILVDPISGKQELQAGAMTAADSARIGIERQRLNMEKANESGGGKAPAGYRWAADGSLEAIPGGPADKGAGLDSRQGVMFQRVLSSANAGLNDLKNISELPVGASTGTFGIGASPGHSIFAAGRDALRNKLSGQEVQDYNTMIAGLSRNLSTIETAGLAPNGSITASMDSIMLREGDSGLTKLRKLSQARQIIERGLETNLANPKIPQPQKDIVKSILDGVADAIPYTQHDITQLQQRQATNPHATLQDVARQSGLSSSKSTGAGHPADIQALLDKYAK